VTNKLISLENLGPFKPFKIKNVDAPLPTVSAINISLGIAGIGCIAPDIS
jgi:hypothetical protein